MRLEMKKPHDLMDHIQVQFEICNYTYVWINTLTFFWYFGNTLTYPAVVLVGPAKQTWPTGFPGSSPRAHHWGGRCCRRRPLKGWRDVGVLPASSFYIVSMACALFHIYSRPCVFQVNRRVRRFVSADYLMRQAILKGIDIMAKYPYNPYSKKIFDALLSVMGSPLLSNE